MTNLPIWLGIGAGGAPGGFDNCTFVEASVAAVPGLVGPQLDIAAVMIKRAITVIGLFKSSSLVGLLRKLSSQKGRLLISSKSG